MQLKISPNMQDYLETIHLLDEKYGYVRVKDIADHMQISRPSVSGAMKNLEKQGLVSHPRYDRISLTKNGEKAATAIYEKHRLIRQFLENVLELDASIAEADACRIEHNICNETFEGLKKFMNENI